MLEVLSDYSLDYLYCKYCIGYARCIIICSKHSTVLIIPFVRWAFHPRSMVHPDQPVRLGPVQEFQNFFDPGSVQEFQNLLDPGSVRLFHNFVRIKINVGKSRIRHTVCHIQRLWNWMMNLDRLKIDWIFKFKVVICRIRLFPTMFSKLKWVGSGLPFNLTCIFLDLSNWNSLQIKNQYFNDLDLTLIRFELLRIT